MWFAVGTVIGFFAGFIWCVLFSKRTNHEAVIRLKKENAALARKVHLIEHIYSSRRAKKLRIKSSLSSKKKSCDKSSCDGSCKKEAEKATST